MSELKPCPFCGSKARISWDEYRGDYKSPHATVDCLSDDCSASIELDGETLDAAKERVTNAWNTRAAQITPQAGEPFMHWLDPETNKVIPLYRAAPPRPACDGNHAAPACADPECWQRPSPVAPTIPEGWQLTPIEPDSAMCAMGDSNWSGFCKDDGDVRKAARRLYKAMCAARPEPPDSPGTTGGS